MMGVSAMKKTMILLLTAMLLLCGCDKAEPHDHVFSESWDRDAPQQLIPWMRRAFVLFAAVW